MLRGATAAPADIVMLETSAAVVAALGTFEISALLLAASVAFIAK